MASIIKVDQIQSDSGNVSLTGNVTTLSSSVVNFGAGQFYKDASGNVGIGTSSPTTKLHIEQGTVLISGTLPILQFVDTNSFSDANDRTIVRATTDDSIFQVQWYDDSAATTTTLTDISSAGAQSSVIPGGTTLYPAFAARAWVNFNGTGTVAIRGSGNVTSITDNGTGNYTLNFTTAMPDANYAVMASSTLDLASAADTVTVGVIAANETSAPNLKSTTQVTIGTAISTITATDCAEIYIAIFS
jgi:hypothetical protein